MVSFHVCMHGGQRDKRSDFWYGGGVDLASLQATCDGSHEHIPWGLTKELGTGLATSAERSYPVLLCRRIAKLAAKAIGVVPPSKLVQASDKVHGLTQPRKNLVEVIPEFKETNKKRRSGMNVQHPKLRLWKHGQRIPSGCVGKGSAWTRVSRCSAFQRMGWETG